MPDRKGALGRESRILIVTGAGVSVGSGLPTYFGKIGVYTGLDSSPEEVLSAANMRKRPEVIWDAIHPLIESGLSAEPSLAHRGISALQATAAPGNTMIFTQNIDMLHEKAGSSNVVHIHGRADRVECRKCNSLRQAASRFQDVESTLRHYVPGQCPRCPRCDGRLRPDIVPFGGKLNVRILEQCRDFIRGGVDVVFVVGTRAIFPYIQSMIQGAEKRGAVVINVNPDLEPSLSGYQHIPVSADEYFGLWVKKEHAQSELS